jgi:Uma2 family endonuclease
MGMPAAIPLYTVDDLENFPEDGNRYELLDGVLLVTPQAEWQHQLVGTRIAYALMSALGDDVAVTCPGAIIHGAYTELQPDVLAGPPRALETKWKDITEHWLAVEVYSPSSRIYDREFKVPEYLRRGVDQIWLVDIPARSVEVFAQNQSSRIEQESLVWTPPTLSKTVAINLSDVFR